MEWVHEIKPAAKISHFKTIDKHSSLFEIKNVFEEYKILFCLWDSFNEKMSVEILNRIKWNQKYS